MVYSLISTEIDYKAFSVTQTITDYLQDLLKYNIAFWENVESRGDK